MEEWKKREHSYAQHVVKSLEASGIRLNVSQLAKLRSGPYSLFGVTFWRQAPVSLLPPPTNSASATQPSSGPTQRII